MYTGNYGPTEETLKFVEESGEGVNPLLPTDFDRSRRQNTKEPDIQTHELLHVLGLLMARMLNPHHRRFRDHWGTTVKGAVPRGIFSDCDTSPF
ncbi:hypothetical protein PHPALM_27846 [Phytophthora palmivora]|uniref:Uncharacterized protein n=1 Tax=Phytophthora palmivora TaxID=4796 RepID=A0A2P4XBL8_9STRA|nr:hypothetical protein PHPALM_27846 [Phytophthora palmivora]